MARLRNTVTGVVVNVPQDSLDGYKPVEEKKPAPKRSTAKPDEK